jgi:hypothetical protein
MPTIEYALTFRYNMIDRSLVWIANDSVGNFCCDSKEINIAFTDRDKRSKIYTLVNELAHLIQHYHIGPKFMTLYKKYKHHHSNQYEHEARNATNRFDNNLSEQPELKKQFKKYNWVIKRETPICGSKRADAYYRDTRKADWLTKSYFGRVEIY